MLERLTTHLKQRLELDSTQIQEAIGDLADEAVATPAKADFLTALALKGETTDEIAGFALELRKRAIEPPVDEATRARGIVDVVGTGGDRTGTFNISTTAAILVASAGIPVAKHGNRAVTSQTGSADVLEALGVPVSLAPAEAARMLRDHHFAFFLAPLYHPSFKNIGPARRLCAERGQRTIFNFLGPLLNPARPFAQLVGVPRPELCEPIAVVLCKLGVLRAMVVCGLAGGLPDGPMHMDELSTLSETTVAEFYHERGLCVSVLASASFPTQPVSLSDLAGGDRETNATHVRRILSGDERGPRRDAVLLNAGAALLVAGRAGSISEGWETAAELIDTGVARAKLREISGR